MLVDVGKPRNKLEVKAGCTKKLPKFETCWLVELEDRFNV